MNWMHTVLLQKALPSHRCPLRNTLLSYGKDCSQSMWFCCTAGNRPCVVGTPPSDRSRSERHPFQLFEDSIPYQNSIAMCWKCHQSLQNVHSSNSLFTIKCVTDRWVSSGLSEEMRSKSMAPGQALGTLQSMSPDALLMCTKSEGETVGFTRAHGEISEDELEPKSLSFQNPHS